MRVRNVKNKEEIISNSIYTIENLKVLGHSADRGEAHGI